MVLRKPYKFLIKHFRAIHLIMAFMSSYLLFRTNRLIKFFNEYIGSKNTLVGYGTSNEYFTLFMSVCIIFILIGSITILVIMKMKEKPILFYIISIIAYLLVAIIYMYDKSLIIKLESVALDIRTIKLAHDFTLISFLAQTLGTIILFIRGIGFSLKKFDFEQDLQLDIDESDDEEFEFDVTIDKDKIVRNISKKIRNIKYGYHENKLIANIGIGLVIVIIAVTALVKHKKDVVYKQNQYINLSSFSYTISDSYILNSDYRGNQVTENYLVAAKIKIKKNVAAKQQFETARVLLKIGKISYRTTNTYADKLIDIGTTYNENYLKNDYSEYLIVFEIPKKSIKKKMYFSYNDPYAGELKTKLSTKKIGNDKNTTKSSVKKKIVINNDLFQNISFKITDFELNDKIRATYRFCEVKGVCYDSYEYIVPTLADNYDKTILRINSEIDFNKQEISGYDELADFITTFGTIRYKVSDGDKIVTKQMTNRIKRVVPAKSKTNGVYYFEVYSDIKKASEITLVLNIRNSIYEYILKKD